VPGDGGFLLHAVRVELPHPRTGAPVVVECRAPPPLRAASG
jgi:23S rRNA pseudouridine1911/1915/1917 synthase